MSAPAAKEPKVIHFKNGSSLRITHPTLIDMLELAHQSPSNSRDKKFRAFVDEKLLPAQAKQVDIDEEQFIVTMAALCDQAYERKINDFELGRSLMALLVFALVRADAASLSQLYWAGLSRICDTIADMVMAYQGEKRAADVLEPLQNNGCAWSAIRDLLGSSKPSKLFANALVPLFAQLFDFTTVPLCEEAWKYLLDPLLRQIDGLDTKSLEEEAKHPESQRVRVFQEGKDFQGDMSIVPMILINSCLRMVCSTGNETLIQVVLQQQSVLLSLTKSVASFQSLQTIHAARYATESLALLLCPTLPHFEARVEAVFKTAPKIAETLTSHILKAITSDALWKEAAASQNDVDRQSLVILIIMSISCLHSISESKTGATSLLEIPQGQTDSLLSQITKSWAKFSVKAQVRGYEKYTWARLRHTLIDTIATLSCDFRRKSYPIYAIAEFPSLLVSMQAKICGDVSSETLIAEATRLKDKGNLYFEKHAFAWAEKFYSAGIKLVSFSADAATNQLACMLYSNRAQANLEMKYAQAALEDAQKALSIQANHTKSSERVKQAQEMLGKKVAPLHEYQDASGQHTTSLVPLVLFKFKW